MKNNTKIILAIGAIAGVAVAIHLHKKSKEQKELAAAKQKELDAAKPTNSLSGNTGIVRNDPAILDLDFKGKVRGKSVQPKKDDEPTYGSRGKGWNGKTGGKKSIVNDFGDMF